jgi:hypothetical protein
MPYIVSQKDGPHFYVLHSFLEVGFLFLVHSVPDFMSYIVSKKEGSFLCPT